MSPRRRCPAHGARCASRRCPHQQPGGAIAGRHHQVTHPKRSRSHSGRNKIAAGAARQFVRNKAVFTAWPVPGAPALADPGPSTPAPAPRAPADPGSEAQAIGGVYWGTGWSGTTPHGGAFVGSKCTRVDSGPGGTGATLTAASCTP